jgi:alkylated DNA repair dioxygenase AlkB
MNYIKLLRKKQQEEKEEGTKRDLLSSSSGNCESAVTQIDINQNNIGLTSVSVVATVEQGQTGFRHQCLDEPLKYLNGFKAGLVDLSTVGGLPSMHYCSRFLNEDAQRHLLSRIMSKETEYAWKRLRSRRLQCWGVPARGQDSEISGSQFPLWLEVIVNAVARQAIFPTDILPNQVLINDYSESEGILHHCDGNAYHDTVAIISLGSSRLLTFRPKLSSEDIGIKYSGDVVRVLLEPGSLFVFSGHLFSDMLHGIVSDDEPGCDTESEEFGCYQALTTQGVFCINEIYSTSADGEMLSVKWKPRTSLTIRSVKC